MEHKPNYSAAFSHLDDQLTELEMSVTDVMLEAAHAADEYTFICCQEILMLAGKIFRKAKLMERNAEEEAQDGTT